MSKASKMTKVKSLDDLYARAKSGDERYQRLCIVALENLGCEHLARKRHANQPKYEAYHYGLMEYVGALVGEYGESEASAFRGVRDEVNGVLNCINQADLEWSKSDG